MKYTIIAENDITQWKDLTGELYHFPKRYLELLTVGTKVIYYKGRLVQKKFEKHRLSNLPHYFGVGEIGKVYLDTSSNKEDYFAEILNYQKFSKAVPFRIDGTYLEIIPISRTSNYWRDGVRSISEEIYYRIKLLAGISPENISIFNDNNIESPSLESDFFEGGQKKKFTTTYERDSKAREQAVTIHGYTCMACSLNFEEKYGEWGKGYIHVHHIKPISTIGEVYKVNPRTDLIVLCANCHAMVHRRKDRVLSLDDLISFLKG